MKIINIIIFLILSFNSLYSFDDNNINISLNKSIYEKNELAILKISAKVRTSNIIFPNIKYIYNYNIIDTKENTNILFENGIFYKVYNKEYYFYPKDSFNLKKYNIIIDNKEYKTKNISLVFNSYEEVKRKDIISFKNTVITDVLPLKHTVYVGQPIKHTTIFSIYNEGNIKKLKLIPWKEKNFWTKNPKDIIKNKNLRLEQRMTKWIIPQKKGKLKIPKIGLEITKTVIENGKTINKINKIFTKEYKFNIKELPENVYLYGDYKIKSYINTKNIEINKPIKLVIEIDSKNSNYDDIQDFEFYIEDVNIYKEKIENFDNIKERYFQNIRKQHFTLISDENFVIPPFYLTFFDKNTQKIKTISTQEIPIHFKELNNNKINIKLISNNNKIIYSDENSKTFNKLLFFIVFIGSTSIIFFLIFYYLIKKEKKREKNRYELILLIKDKKELLKHLILNFEHLQNNKNYWKVLQLLKLKIKNNKNINNKNILIFITKIEDDVNFNNIIF